MVDNTLASFEVRDARGTDTETSTEVVSETAVTAEVALDKSRVDDTGSGDVALANGDVGTLTSLLSIEDKADDTGSRDVTLASSEVKTLTSLLSIEDDAELNEVIGLTSDDTNDDINDDTSL